VCHSLLLLLFFDFTAFGHLSSKLRIGHFLSACGAAVGLLCTSHWILFVGLDGRGAFEGLIGRNAARIKISCIKMYFILSGVWLIFLLCPAVRASIPSGCFFCRCIGFSVFGFVWAWVCSWFGAVGYFGCSRQFGRFYSFCQVAGFGAATTPVSGFGSVFIAQ
jgi:hypothetical protein